MTVRSVWILEENSDNKKIHKFFNVVKTIELEMKANLRALNLRKKR